jgi:phospholipase C
MGVFAGCAAAAVAAAPLAAGSASAHGAASAQVMRQQQVQQVQQVQQRAARPAPPGLPGGFKHLVVIYEENHSFDNLYGGWGSVNGQRVNGRSRAPAAHTTQVAQNRTKYSCLLQYDVNLTSPPQPADCADTAHAVTSHFANKPFAIDRFIRPADTTCPTPGVFAPNGVLKGSGDPGGCTRDLVNRFYQEQYQIHGGRQDRYTTGSDAVGLTQGFYKTRELPIYKYLHRNGAPKYVVADRFFQAAFGGSFLNHQWLIAARTPLDTSHGAAGAGNSELDGNGMVTKYPLYTPTGTVKDGQLTRKCSDPTRMRYRSACGDFAVNTVQPSSPPAAPAPAARIPLINDGKYPNIGDRLTRAGISWKWYSGGWREATAGAPGPLFQFHHQPFNYFANYAKGKPGRAHLKDERRFLTAARTGHLPTVSFVKPYGAEDEHPGYASESNGSAHLVNLLKTITNGPDARKTLIVVTYDDYGGQWDHVSPPAAGAKKGTHDKWGPGTRIPALVIGRALRRSGVDHTTYDTTSILATIERSFGLAPLSSRDRAVNDLSNAVAKGGRR